MKKMFEKNPFAQESVYWQVLFFLPATAVATAEEAFNDVATSVANFETDEANGIWTFELICSEKPDMEEINRRLSVLSALHNIAMPEAKLEKLVQADWLSQVARDFPPLSIGRFFVHGNHVEEKPRAGSISIQVDAGAAFGSGEHGTTRCCLAALEWLAQSRSFSKVLDMGTGSGILAIAAAKLWKTDVLAVDLDPVSVRVTAENNVTNNVHKFIKTGVSDGYSAMQVKRGAKYDLIIANILARPLIAFAPQLKQNLAEGGVAVLSGLLVSQQKRVLAAHRVHGLSLKRKFIYQDWCTLVIG
ncbi:MAG: 50S ribosomal protein L11 methyltransferase [Rickettsiales bacterium]|jgi:ribosomal protein L11 methyltransferase